VAKKLAAKKVKAGLGRAPSSRVVVPPPKAGPAKKVDVKNRIGSCEAYWGV
jgi:hypothetical protein